MTEVEHKVLVDAMLSELGTAEKYNRLVFDLQAENARLRGLLERLADKPPSTPAPQSTPAECRLPSEWTSRPHWVDPSRGWMYGFPRLYDPAKDGDMTEWLIRNGYPEKLARQGLACTFSEWTEDGEK
jgi:hypothetical protein